MTRLTVPKTYKLFIGGKEGSLNFVVPQGLCLAWTVEQVLATFGTPENEHRSPDDGRIGWVSFNGRGFQVEFGEGERVCGLTVFGPCASAAREQDKSATVVAWAEQALSGTGLRGE